MKAKLIMIFCLLCSTLYGCSTTPKGIKQDPSEWQPFSTVSQEKILSDYVNALDEFAKVIPIIDDDTEAQWAADTVHIMASAFRKENRSFQKNMAMICHMQDYIAYGMVYFNAIIGTYKEPQLARYALSIIAQSDSLFNGLKEVDYNDIRKLAFMQSTSAYNMQLFNTLNRINNDKDINRELYLSLYSFAVVDSVSQLKDYSDVEILKVSCVMESYSYFQMICPLLSLFAGSQEEYDSNLDVLTEAAKHFDSQATPVFQAVSGRNKINVLNDSEFEDWLIKSYQHKAKLVRLLTRFVSEWGKQEKN
jgi:hypothetical protein